MTYIERILLQANCSYVTIDANVARLLPRFSLVRFTTTPYTEKIVRKDLIHKFEIR